MKASIYSHFEQLLSLPDKPLSLTDENFATKVNPRRSYPECTINTGSLFDEEGDPIFNVEIASAPVSPEATGKPKTRAKKTGSSLKRTLGVSTSGRKKNKKTAVAQPSNEQIEPQPEVQAQQPLLPPVLAPPPPPVPVVGEPIVEPALPPAPTPTKRHKPFRYPSVLALPSKTAIPIDPSDAQLLQCSFLPTSSLKGNSLFNAFITFTSNSENNCVLVSRAFASTTITLQDCHIAVRQVFSIFLPPSTFRQKLNCFYFVLSCATPSSAWNFQKNSYTRSVSFGLAPLYLQKLCLGQQC